MNIISKLSLILRFPISQYYKCKLSTPKVLSDYDTLHKIIDEKKSVSRFGDGELELMLGYSISFQEKSEALKKRLREVALYDNDNLLVCIPDVFYTRKDLLEKYKKKDAIWWTKNNFILAGYWKKFFRKSLYGNAFISRFYMIYKERNDLDNYVELLKTLWNNRSIVLVEGEETKLGENNDLFNNAKNIKKIICPSQNAFSKYEKIYLDVLKNTKKDDLIIISLGPTATILASDLSKKGRQALDLGHFDIEYMWYKMGATTKVKIDGKHVNEAR